jgi:hypothetical protein
MARGPHRESVHHGPWIGERRELAGAAPCGLSGRRGVVMAAREGRGAHREPNLM